MPTLRHSLSSSDLLLSFTTKTVLQATLNATRREYGFFYEKVSTKLFPVFFWPSFNFQDALLHHSHRATYQASIWMTLGNQQKMPPREGFGWEVRNNHWQPVWTRLPKASKACSELMNCGVQDWMYQFRCKCFKTILPCMKLCNFTDALG